MDRKQGLHHLGRSKSPQRSKDDSIILSSSYSQAVQSVIIKEKEPLQ
jgi:hypothetical protein